MSYLDIFADLMNNQCEADDRYVDRLRWDADGLDMGCCHMKLSTDFGPKYTLCKTCERNLQLLSIIKLQFNEIQSLKESIESLKDDVESLKNKQS